MDSMEKEQLKKIIRDRIDELILVLQPDEPAAAADDEAAKLDKLVSSDVDTTVHSMASRDLPILRRNLEWLDSEDGGYCAQCGGEIQRARLLAVPATRLCIVCASQRESVQ